jgi:hypothetical protein
MSPLREAAEKAGIVKPLRWVQCATDEVGTLRLPYSKHAVALHFSETEFGTYGIVKSMGRYEAWLRTKPVSGSYVSSAEAMNAAQADYEARILSALNPDFLSELDTARKEVERLGKLSDQQFERIDSLTADLERVGRQSAASDRGLTEAKARIAELEGLVSEAQYYAELWRDEFDSDGARDLIAKIDAALSPETTEGGPDHD